MYGTVARLQVKPGSLEALQKWGSSGDSGTIHGFIGTYLYQMDTNPNELYLTVIFTDKASYVANAQDPAQHSRYLEMRSYLAAEPEWHDGEIVYATEAVAHGL